jgi:hypothetical protein
MIVGLECGVKALLFGDPDAKHTECRDHSNTARGNKSASWITYVIAFAILGFVAFAVGYGWKIVVEHLANTSDAKCYQVLVDCHTE